MSANILYFIISAMGTSIMLENLVIATIGPTFRTYPEVFPKVPIEIGSLAIGRLDRHNLRYLCCEPYAPYDFHR